MVENFGREITLATRYRADFGPVENGDGAIAGVSNSATLCIGWKGRKKTWDEHLLHLCFVQKFGLKLQTNMANVSGHPFAL